VKKVQKKGLWRRRRRRFCQNVIFVFGEEVEGRRLSAFWRRRKEKAPKSSLAGTFFYRRRCFGIN